MPNKQPINYPCACIYTFCTYLCMSKCNQWTLNETEEEKKKQLWNVYLTSKTKHSEQILCIVNCCRTHQNWSKAKFPNTYIIEIETKLFHFFIHFLFFLLLLFCSGHHCTCSVLTIIHQNVFTWIRVSFSIPAFMLIFDPNKETIVNDESHRRFNGTIRIGKKKNENENLNWISMVQRVRYCVTLKKIRFSLTIGKRKWILKGLVMLPLKYFGFIDNCRICVRVRFCQ